jgi:probable HAF family extracellular repeat protein
MRTRDNAISSSMIRLLVVMFIPWLAPVAWSQQHLPQYYEITQLSVPQGSSQTTPMALNDSQQVALAWTNANHRPRAGLYDLRTGTMIDLGTVGGSEATPTGINNLGEVVGYSNNAAGWWNAFVWRNGTITNLGTLPSGLESGAYAINDSGNIVGWSLSLPDAQSPRYAARFTGGGVISLGGPESNAYDVNSFGVAAGFAPSSSTGMRRAVIFKNGAVTELAVPDRPGTLSFGVAINDSEYVAGHYVDYWASFQRSFIVSANGSMTDLGTLPGYNATQSYAMNNFGMVVGGVGNGASTSTAARAFVYGDCRIVDLTNMIDPASGLKPYVTLSAGRDINNSGWIIASGSDSRDPARWPRAYLLKPVGPPSNICT